MALTAGPTLQLLDIGDAGPMDHPHRTPSALPRITQHRFRPTAPGERFTSPERPSPPRLSPPQTVTTSSQIRSCRTTIAARLGPHPHSSEAPGHAVGPPSRHYLSPSPSHAGRQPELSRQSDAPGGRDQILDHQAGTHRCTPGADRGVANSCGVSTGSARPVEPTTISADDAGAFHLSNFPRIARRTSASPTCRCLLLPVVVLDAPGRGGHHLDRGPARCAGPDDVRRDHPGMWVDGILKSNEPLAVTWDGTAKLVQGVYARRP